jgi:hypothetical protein
MTITDAPKSTVATGRHAAPTVFFNVALVPAAPLARSTYALQVVTDTLGNVNVTLPFAFAVPLAIPAPAPLSLSTTFSFALNPEPLTVSGFSRTTCSDAFAWRTTCAWAAPVTTTAQRTISSGLIGYFTDLMYATSALAWASEMFPIAVVMIPDE